MVRHKENIYLEGIITCLTGIAVGGTNDSLNIGGISKAVIRDAATGKPYIPGSSIKGKLRSLLEQRYGKCQLDNKGLMGPSFVRDNIAAALFGSISNKANDQTEQRVSAVLVRDARLISKPEDFRHLDLDMTELKTEVMICRVTAAANPRTNERVPAGAQFQFSMIVRISEGETYFEARNDRSRMLKALCEALQLLQDDYIGGNGSRGYGQVAFEFTRAEVRGHAYYADHQAAESILPQVQALFEKTPHSTPTAP